MAFGSDIAKLLASLDLDTRSFEQGARRVDDGLGRMEGNMGRVSTRSIALGAAIGTGIERLAEKGIDVLFDSLRAGEENLRILQDATAQTNAVIESTGGAAGQTAESVRRLAEELENLTTADDKSIQQGENLLLTFTNIGKDVFPDATKAMVNMAIALNKGNAETADFDSSAIQLGKALNDPIKGITALRRVGVAFTADQEKRIKTLVKEGKLQEAQGVILDELTKEFGKAGEAAGKSEAAGLRRFHDAIEDIQISLASGLSPALDEIRGDLTTAMNDPRTQEAVRNLGIWLGEAAKNGLEFAKSIPWGQVADGLKTAAGFAGDLIGAFTHLPPGVQATIIGLAGLNKLAGGGVIKIGVDLFKEGAQGLLGQFFQRGSPANPMFTKEIGLPGGGGGPGAVPVGGKGGGIGALGKLFLVGEAIGLVIAVNEVRDAVASSAHEQAKEIGVSLDRSLHDDNNSTKELSTKLSGIDAGIQQIKDLGNIPEAVFHDTLVELEKMRAEVVAELQHQTAVEKTAREDTPADEIAAELRKQQKSAELVAPAIKAVQGALAAITGGTMKWKPADVIQVEDRRVSGGLQKLAREDTPADQALSKAVHAVRASVKIADEKAERKADTQHQAIQAMHRTFENKAEQIRQAENTLKSTTQTGLSNVRTAEQTAADRIVSAIRALDLSVVVNTVVNSSGGYKTDYLNNNKPKVYGP